MAVVLVVDDDQDVRGLLLRTLTAHGHEVVLAAGFDDALVSMTRQVPDVLVTDFSMPPHTGEELLREVAARYPAMGRILFTGRRGVDTRGAQASAHMMLRKGCPLVEVSLAVLRCCAVNRPG